MKKSNFSSIESIIKTVKKNGMFILVDDESKHEEMENEGDLVISTSAVNPNHINFMAKHARGLICLAMDNTQSKKIGLIFKKNEIKIDNIYSSEWCRCKDTAKYAFDDFETFDALNSFYDIRFAANEDKQIKDFYEFIDSIDNKNNIVFVTHYVVIGAILNIGTSSGEIVVTDKNLNIIGSIDTL